MKLPNHDTGFRQTSIAFILLFITVATLGAPSYGRAEEFTGDILVQSQAPGSSSYRINEFDFDGSVLQTLNPPAPPNSGDLQNPRDLVVNRAGRIQLYNGTFDPYLSTFSPTTDSWGHRTHPGWSTINNVSYGGIGQIGNNVFLTNMSTSGNPSSGLIVVEDSTGNSFEIANNLQATDLTVGLDRSLWVLVGSNAFEFDPDTFDAGRTVSLSAAVGNDIRSIAVDSNGNFYVGDWGGSISRLDSEGALLASLNPNAGSILDVDVSADGLLAFGTRLDGAWLTNTALNPATQLESGRWNSFVTFVRPGVVPEPSIAITLLGLLAIGGLQTHRRREARCF